MTDNIEPIEFFDDDLKQVDKLPKQDAEKLINYFKATLKTLWQLEQLNIPFPDEVKDNIVNLTNLINSILSSEDLGFEDSDVAEAHKVINESSALKELVRLKGLTKMLPTLQSKIPEWHTMAIQKLVTELQHRIINDGQYRISVANKGKKNVIESYVLATYDEVDSIISLTEFDRQVQDAVSSLWEYGHESHIITPDMVARAMNHKTQTEKISPQFKGAVTKSLEKMRRIHIELDASEEAKKREAMLNGEPVTSFKIDDYLLSLKGIEVGAGGKTVKGYLMQSEPLLLTYAKMTKQLATVNAQLLDIKEVDKKGNITISIKNNEARVAVKGYLLRRIAVMKNDRTKKKPRQSNIILFNTLFEETGIPQDSNAANTKKYAFQVLDYFKAMDYIKGYIKRKNRKSFDAVIINL